jgi:hypothetical protein
MTRFPRRAAIVLAALLAMAGASQALGAGPAHASTSYFCVITSVPDLQGLNCLNDWNNGGSGNLIRMYNGGNPNEDFARQRLTGRCGGGFVTATCPFANTAFDARYEGFPIYQLTYGSTGLCVAGGNAGSAAVLGACNNPNTGTGGAVATVFVDHNDFMISLYWSNHTGGPDAACMESMALSGAGSYVDLDYPTSAGCDAWEQA